MQEFRGKVAVVTGAASGIGRALAGRCAAEGMKVVLADIEPGPLDQAGRELRAGGAEVLAVPTDVSKRSGIENLAKQTLAAYGAVHLLFNNAGVGSSRGFVWQTTPADWEWVLGVNLWSIIHAIQVFVPILLEQEAESHIINTASMAGLISFPGSSIYQVSKHAVVGLSENLYHELALQKANIKVSVLCPAWVNTRIAESERNRPDHDQQQPGEESGGEDRFVAGVRQAVRQGLSPEKVAQKVFEAIRQDQFYILTHRGTEQLVEMRAQAIVAGHKPLSAPM